MNTIVFTIALFLSIALVAQSADAIANRKERDVTLHVILAALAWGAYHWLTH